MTNKKIVLLGNGFISVLYISTLYGTSAKDRAVMAYSHNGECAERFAKKGNIQRRSTNLDDAVSESEVDTEIIGHPNDVRLEAALKLGFTLRRLDRHKYSHPTWKCDKNVKHSPPVAAPVQLQSQTQLLVWQRYFASLWLCC